MTVGGRGLCTASFISERHLISASHCYASDGPVSLQVSAPTWHKEKPTAVIYGINQAADPPDNLGFGTCAAADWTIVFTNVSQYISFIEQAVGKPCTRKQVDDLAVAQCW